MLHQLCGFATRKRRSEWAPQSPEAFGTEKENGPLFKRRHIVRVEERLGAELTLDENGSLVRGCANLLRFVDCFGSLSFV